MRHLTLLTDFGRKDYYLGLVKARLLAVDLGIQIHDLSHEIEPFNLAQAAFLFKHCYAAFPAGTLHLLSVYNYYSAQREYLALETGGQFFLGPNNGLFSLIFERIPDKVYLLDSRLWSAGSMEVAEVFAQGLKHLQRYGAWEGIGPKTSTYLERLPLQPSLGPNQIRGHIVHIDHYGNAISNISRTLFERVGQGRRFEIQFRRFDPLTHLLRDYAEAVPGDLLGLFNAADYLELAVYLGHAANLYGLKVDDSIIVAFAN